MYNDLLDVCFGLTYIDWGDAFDI